MKKNANEYNDIEILNDNTQIENTFKSRFNYDVRFSNKLLAL